MSKKLLLALCVSAVFAVLPPPDCRGAMATISGKVVAEDTGIGLSEFRVRAMPGDFRAFTNEEGIYVLRDLIPGKTYTLSFFKEDSPYINEYDSVEVPLSDEKLVVYVDHTMKLGGSVSGTVYAANGTTPLSDAAVAARSLEQADWLESYRTSKTDGEGNYLIQGLPESEECVVGVAVYGHAWIEKTVRIEKGHVTGNVDFSIKWDDVTGVSGAVRSKERKAPLVNARVVLVDTSGKTVGIALTTASGGYSIVGVSPGGYKAVVTLGGYFVTEKSTVVVSGKSTMIDFLIQTESEEQRPPDVRKGYGYFQ